MSPVDRLLAAKASRAFGDGYVSLLLPAYLLDRGFTPWQVGLVATATLLGSGLLTLLIGLNAYRYPNRLLLLSATALMAATGLGFAFVTDFWPLLLVAFVGTLNPSGGDVGVFLPLEHAALAHLVDDRRRLLLLQAELCERSLDDLPESMRAYAPTVASVLTLLGTHLLMHAGQFVPIRRKIGKPALF